MSKEFILFLVNEQYGDTFNILLNTLLSEPTQSLTLSQILQKTRIGFQEIRQLLILAIKNNLIKLDSKSQEQQLKHPKEYCEENYVINIQEILQIYRYPKFIDYASKHFGILESLIIQQLLILQSSTVEQCINEIQADIAQQISFFIFIFVIDFKEDFSSEQMYKKFFNLVEKGFIKEAYLLNFSHLQEQEELNQPKAKYDEEEELFKELNQTFKEKHKKKSKKVKLNEELAIQIEKELQKKEQPKIIQSSMEQKNKIYKINYRQFIHEFRTQQIFNLTKFQVNIQAASILQFMISKSKFIDQAQKFKITG